MSPGPTLSVVIATIGRKDLLHRTLSSLGRAKIPDGFEGVWIVENGGEPEVEALARETEWPYPVHYQFLATRGKSAALNQGVRLAKGELIVFLDDDVRADSHLLEAYGAAASGKTEGAVYLGKLEVDYEDGAAPPGWLLDYLPPSAKGHDPSLGKLWALGGNFAAFRGDILAVGGFDPDLGSGGIPDGSGREPVGEETELVERLTAFGCERVAVPEATVWHWVPRDRCSPVWALDRLYRHAFTDGLRFARGPSGRLLSGVPPWRWRQLVGSIAKLLANPLRPSRGARFRARANVRKALGFVRGARAGLRESGRFQGDPVSDRPS